MPSRAAKFCRHAGCAELVTDPRGYCPAHMDEYEEKLRADQRWKDRKRGSSRERGYDTRWSKYSKAFLAKPENRWCVLHLDARCAVIAQCVDHIDPPENARDPRFWDKSNHQPACIHCNSVKLNRCIKGTYVFGKDEING